ncbi:MAG: tRNA (N(6)-L-threonylcarbamoyladenosine(37)-C(2))-methylthiotransferase MtaB [Clostridiales bacterium]|nr:tRNA (N(6)-L-threonylcarbamoyladenosine(37)-C(2))-methylthiotransferase MtaB [Clostridiales bacterium]
MKRAAFGTLGCKVNQYETEAMEELFLKKGYSLVSFDEEADVYVINTCSVTNMSDRKSRQMIRRAKKKNPEAIVAVTGCYAQTAAEDVAKIEGVNLVLGTKDRKNIVELCEAASPHTQSCLVGSIMDTHEFEALTITRYTDRTRAFIKIQEGCNQFCSYCIIPYARGPVRSRPEAEVLSEIRRLADNGYKEIILVGIHVASYGVDLGDTSLEQLLVKTEQISKIERIRLSSIEPMTLNRAFIDKIRVCKKLCHHFHISLQSGSDETLRRMNRKYTTAQFKDIVTGIREAFEDAAITTDIMVGFAGESEEEFNETLRFIDEISFSDAHVFQYSPRRGTPAAKRPDQISPEVKEARSKLVIEHTKKSRDEFIGRFVGKTLPVLFEQPARDGLFEGKTGNYITVHAPSKTDISGEIKDVFLKSASDGIIIGEIV